MKALKNIKVKVLTLLGLYKEEEYFYPSEYIIIERNPEALQRGIIDDLARELHYYKGKTLRKFPYSENFLDFAREVKIPIFDNTADNVEPEINVTVKGGEFEYAS